MPYRGLGSFVQSSCPSSLLSYSLFVSFVCFVVKSPRIYQRESLAGKAHRVRFLHAGESLAGLQAGLPKGFRMRHAREA
jgi:hypothetical protein